MTQTTSTSFPLLWTYERFDFPFGRTRSDALVQRVPGQIVLAEGVARVQISSAALPSWASAWTEFETFLCSVAEVECEGNPIATATWNGKTLPIVFESDGQRTLTFDLCATVRSVLYERYRVERRPLSTWLPVPYFRWVPRSLRCPIKRMVHAFRPLNERAFPAWPIEPSLSIWEHLSFGQRPGGLWPDGKQFAIAPTHDVESRVGLRLAREVAEIENDLGVSSTWFIVGRLASKARRLADWLRARGHEIALHGVVHDNAFPFISTTKMDARLKRCASFVRDYDIAGFRSPSLLRSDAMYDVLSDWFRYDSSVVDTGRMSPHARPTGCGSVFPFRRLGVVIAPITLPMDSALLFMGWTPERIVELWKRKVEWIRTIGGMVVLDTHTEPHFFGAPGAHAAYAKFLQWLRTFDDAWWATLRELVDIVAEARR